MSYYQLRRSENEQIVVDMGERRTLFGRHDSDRNTTQTTYRQEAWILLETKLARQIQLVCVHVLLLYKNLNGLRLRMTSAIRWAPTAVR